MVVIVDRLLELPKAAARVAIQHAQSTEVVCPKCGCRPAVHRAGNHGTRCERHPACAWAALAAEPMNG